MQVLELLVCPFIVVIYFICNTVSERQVAPPSPNLMTQSDTCVSHLANSNLIIGQFVRRNCKQGNGSGLQADNLYGQSSPFCSMK